MISEFGKTTDGQTIEAITLTGGNLTATVLTWGAVLRSVRLKDVAYDLTQGSDSAAAYAGAMRYHGSVIGPAVNRITGAKAVIDGHEHQFEANLNGNMTLHCGTVGTHLKLWTMRDHGPDHATLSIALPDGEGGFPGNRQIVARFEILPPGTLRMTLTATTDAPTLMNLANHSYWNLDGTDSFAGHKMRIAADRYLPATPDFAPTGEIVDVEGTAFDFRNSRDVAPHMPDLDNNFCLGDTRVPLREVMWLTGQTGVSMTIATTEPGLQVFDNRPVFKGLAFEPQFWPDATNNPDFPDITLRPGDDWQQITEWRFAKP